MRILAVDTTTSSGSAALLEDRRLVGEIGGESGTTHSARLLGAVDHLLRAEGLADRGHRRLSPSRPGPDRSRASGSD